MILLYSFHYNDFFLLFFGGIRNHQKSTILGPNRSFWVFFISMDDCFLRFIFSPRGFWWGGWSREWTAASFTGTYRIGDDQGAFEYEYSSALEVQWWIEGWISIGKTVCTYVDFFEKRWDYFPGDGYFRIFFIDFQEKGVLAFIFIFLCYAKRLELQAWACFFFLSEKINGRIVFLVITAVEFSESIFMKITGYLSIVVRFWILKMGRELNFTPTYLKNPLQQ